MKKKVKQELKPRLLEMLDGIAQVPWFSSFAGSLREAIEADRATDKQISFITKLYADSCAISEDTIKEQKKIRKFLVSSYVASSVLDVKTSSFIHSVYYGTASRKMSPRQAQVIEKIYLYNREKILSFLKMHENPPNCDKWMVDS